MCIEVDLNKPLLPKFRLRKEVHIDEYESSHMIYFACCRYVHMNEGCLVVAAAKGHEGAQQKEPQVIVHEAPKVSYEVYGNLMVVVKK